VTSQEKAILDAVADGAFHTATPFMTKSELMEIAAQVSEMLGGNPTKLTRDTVASWYQLGILPEPVRTKRNRLFSVVDVFQAVSVFHLSSCGIRLEACRYAAGLLVDHWLEANFEIAANSLEKTSVLDVAHLLALSTVRGGWEMTWFDATEQLALQTKRSGVVVLLNAAAFFSFTIQLCRHKWAEKARQIVTKRDRLAAKKSRRKEAE